MKTRHRLAVTLLALASLAAGCGDDDDTDDASSDHPSASPTTPTSAAAASFTATFSGDAVQVCAGERMANAAPLDRSAPSVVLFEVARLDGSEPWSNRISPSPPAAFVSGSDEVEGISVVACAIGVEALRDRSITCEADATGGGTVDYQLAPIRWRVDLREAATGQVLAASDDTIVSPGADCPYEFDPDEYEPAPSDANEVQDVVAGLLDQI